jgi:hypothetical protein
LEQDVFAVDAAYFPNVKTVPKEWSTFSFPSAVAWNAAGRFCDS